MKKLSPQNKLSNSAAFNALLICGFAFMSQIPRRCGFIAVYLVPLLWLLFILNSVYITCVLIRSRDDSGVKGHFGRYKVICILTLTCCLVMSCITIPFVKDMINGTEIYKTSYYQIFSKSKELLIYYPDGQDKTIYLTKLQLEYIDNNYNEIDKNRTMKVSDTLTMEYYTPKGKIRESEITMMTEEQKSRIAELRGQGVPFSKIAKQLDLNRDTIKSYCRSYRIGVDTDSVDKDIPHCKNCGTKIVQPPKKKKKIFCCDKCRNAWWAAHPDKINKKAMYTHICVHCKKQFEAYGNDNRKYCSRECYMAERFGE